MRWGLVLALVALPAAAHDGEVHGSAAEAAAHRAAVADAPISAGIPFPVDVGGPFELTDQTGATRTQADPGGQMQMLFFGYANCQAICSVALPMMGEVAGMLADEGIGVTPVMVTVDPDRDTVETIGQPLTAHHPDFVGLTGTAAELAPVYDLFEVEHKVVFEDPEYGPIFAHGSFIYLLDPEGEMLTVLPPILSTDRVAEIVSAYALESAAAD